MNSKLQAEAVESAVDVPKVLTDLLDQTVELFGQGPVLEETEDRPLQPITATITECVRQVLLDVYGHGVDGAQGLIDAAWSLDLQDSFGTADVWQRTFPALTMSVRNRLAAAALPYVAVWMCDQLDRLSGLRADDAWRHEHREDLEWLRKHPTPDAAQRPI